MLFLQFLVDMESFLENLYLMIKTNDQVTKTLIVECHKGRFWVHCYLFYVLMIYTMRGAVAERLRHRSREQRVPSSSPAWTSVLR